jgi:hypothetical protein
MGGPGILMSRQTLKRGERGGGSFEVRLIELMVSFQLRRIFKLVSRTCTALTRTWKLVAACRSSLGFPARGTMRSVGLN